MKQASNYYSSQRLDVAQFVPDQISTILDVGCGYGNFLQFMKDSRNAETWGIELVPTVAEESCKVVDKVICSRVEDAIPLLPDKYFDCITFNDVLEHLIDPGQVLRSIGPKLSSKGILIASIPNVRYYKNLKNLLVKKDWEYVEKGVLDSTHLRFFTKKSIQRLFQMTGYELKIQKGINKSDNKFLQLLNFLSFNHIEDTQYIQYICVAKR